MAENKKKNLSAGTSDASSEKNGKSPEINNEKTVEAGSKTREKNKDKSSNIKNGKNQEAAKEPSAILRELTELGKAKGMLTYKEVMDAFEKVDLPPEKIERIYDALERLGIDVLPEADDEIEDLNLEEDPELSIPEGVTIDDPVRMYLKKSAKYSFDG